MLHRAQNSAETALLQKKVEDVSQDFFDSTKLLFMHFAGRKKESKNFGKRGFNCRRAE